MTGDLSLPVLISLCSMLNTGERGGELWVKERFQVRFLRLQCGFSNPPTGDKFTRPLYVGPVLSPPQVKKYRILHLPSERNNYSYTDLQDASYHLERHENINISPTVSEGEYKKAYYILFPPSMDIWTQSFFVPKPQTISPLIYSKWMFVFGNNKPWFVRCQNLVSSNKTKQKNHPASGSQKAVLKLRSAAISGRRESLGFSYTQNDHEEKQTLGLRAGSTQSFREQQSDAIVSSPWPTQKGKFHCLRVTAVGLWATSSYLPPHCDSRAEGCDSTDVQWSGKYWPGPWQRMQACVFN